VKLLVASEFPPNASGGGPAVVRQMLRGWPIENLDWWSCLPERDDRFGQRVSRHACAGLPAKLLPQRRLTGVKSALLATGWAPLAARHLRQTIHQVQPDAIWVIPHNWSILPLAAILPGAGVGFHVTVQDYVDVHGQVERFGPTRCRRMATLADRLYATATTRDATSHPMIEDLQARTQVGAAQMLHAGVEEEDLRSLENKTSEPTDEIRIAHAGTILVPREFALFVEAVAQWRARMPRPVSLHLYGSHRYAGERWFAPSWMQEHGNLAEAELLTALRGCTWGLAPMALTDEDPRYNRFSFPTKFITYLAAGLPVLALGHPKSSVMQMATRYAVGLATCTSDVDELARQLGETLAAPDPWARYGAEIIRCAGTEFRASRMRAVLHDCWAHCRESTARQRAIRRSNEGANQ